MRRKVLLVIILTPLILMIPFASFAHSGRTDSAGGHRDNYNESGLGSYHYHCGGNPPHLHQDGGCPYGVGKGLKELRSEDRHEVSSLKPVEKDDLSDWDNAEVMGLAASFVLALVVGIFAKWRK